MKPHALDQRAANTRLTHAAWNDRPLVLGKADCARMAASHVARFGYKPGYSRAGRYSTEEGAVRVLRRLGYADMGAWMDDIGLMRIAPARAIVGDVLGFALDDMPIMALSVHVGNGRILGPHAGTGRICIQALDLTVPGLQTFAWAL